MNEEKNIGICVGGATAWYRYDKMHQQLTSVASGEKQLISETVLTQFLHTAEMLGIIVKEA